MGADNTTDFKFAPGKLDKIYLKLSTSTKDYQDLSNDEILLNIINDTFNEKFKNIDKNTLTTNGDLLNRSLIKYYLECKKHEIKDISNVFIFYCDYFNLNYNKTYINLHKNIQELIEDYFIYKIGGYNNYDKLKEKYGVKKHQTLFDICK